MAMAGLPTNTKKSSTCISQSEELLSQALDDAVIEDEPLGGLLEKIKPHRKRISYSKQMSVLEPVFQKTHFPDKATRQEVALKICLPGDKVSMCLKKRRVRDLSGARNYGSLLEQLYPPMDRHIPLDDVKSTEADIEPPP